MKRNHTSRAPLATFHIPPDPPPPVAEAYSYFDDVADKLARRIGEIQEAEEAVDTAKDEDRAAMLEAIDAGKDLPANPNKRQLAAEAKLEALRSTVPALEQAVDAAGNRLAEEIGKVAKTWAEALEPRRQEAADRYAAGIEQAQEALTAIKRTRGAIAWLNAFNVEEARVGRVRPWHGGGQARIEDHRGREYNPADLLQLAATLNDPPPPTYSERRAVRQAERDKRQAQAEAERKQARAGTAP
jgi:hypothetical protein